MRIDASSSRAVREKRQPSKSAEALPALGQFACENVRAARMLASPDAEAARCFAPTLTIQRFRDGERLPMLVDTRGVPLFFPMLFATSQLRNAGAAVNTIKNKLADIKVLLCWEHEHARNLAEEFAKSKFLTLADISSLRDFAQQNMREVNGKRSPDLAQGKVQGELLEAHVKFVDRHQTVGRQQQYNRMSTFADYLEFVGYVVMREKDLAVDVSAVASMAQKIRKHRPRGNVHAVACESHEASVPPELVARFMAVAQVDHPSNPFLSLEVRQRNAILFGLLRYTGIRRGELLSLRIDQFDLGVEPTVWVRRNQDDINDLRPHQPVTKTKERPLPLPRSLADQIQDYIIRVRGKFGVSRRHPYLFVSHRKGHNCGAPLSETALGSRIMLAMRRVDPEFKHLHPHSLRHYFNYELSLGIDFANEAARRQPFSPGIQPISAAQEQDIRAFANGHRSRASGAIYNQRHVREQADAVMLKIQAGMTPSAWKKEERHE